MTRSILRLRLAACLAVAGGAAQAQSLASLSAAPLGMPALPILARPANGVMGPTVRRNPLAPAGSPGQQCRQAIRAAERAAGIPEQLMAAIARIESGRREEDGSVNPWPWSINVEGADRIFDSKIEAVAATRALQKRGVRSIDVGCMQVNLMHHPDAFASLEEAFDPVANANYAARFLTRLHAQTGAWPTATAWYHSATPELGEDYRRKVMAVWPEEKRRAPDPAQLARASLASAWAATRPGGLGAAGVNAATASLAGASLTGASLTGASLTGASLGGMGRLLPAAPGGTAKSLAGYRALPIPLAVRAAPPAINTRD